MWFDPTTLFAGLIASLTVSGLVLLWSWYEDQSELILARGGSGFLLAGLGAAVFAARDDIPHELGQMVGPGMVMLGIGITWAGARAFNRRPAPLWVIGLGTVLWIGFTLTPPLFESTHVRTAVGCAIIASYLLLAALEIRSGAPLRGRTPLAVLLMLHALFVMLRVPLSLGFVPPGVVPVQTQWLGAIVLEGMVFVQICAVLLIALTKERLEERLRAMAETDPLTGLCNRRALFERGSGALAACARTRKPAAVALFDLDEFKAVNDTFGHAAGDAVLQAFAHAAEECLWAGDIVGRIGGEEFALVLPGRDASAATAVAQQIMEQFHHLAAQGHGIACTASGGLAVALDGTGSIEALLGAADQALYDAKREGPNTLRLAP